MIFKSSPEELPDPAIVTFCPAVSPPVACSKVVPSKVRFASPFRPDPVPVTTLLFASLLKDS